MQKKINHFSLPYHSHRISLSICLNYPSIEEGNNIQLHKPMKFTFLQANNPKKIDSFFVYYMSQNNGYFLPQNPGSTDAEKIDILPQIPGSAEAEKNRHFFCL